MSDGTGTNSPRSTVPWLINSHRMKRLAVILIFSVLLSSAMVAHAENESFQKALSLLDEGKNEEAAALFHEAWAGNPDLVEAGYDLGLSLLGQGLADSAAAVFEDVSAHEGVSPSLRADILYNLGLSRALSGQASAAVNPAAAKEAFERAVTNFRDALAASDPDPDFRSDAGYNIEAIWRMVEQLEEQMQQQTSGADSLAQELQDLAADQDQVRQETGSGGDSSDLQQQQEDLGNRAEDLSREMQRRGMEEAARETKQAQAAQEKAAEELSQQHMAEAGESQDEAMDHLREALASMLQQEAGEQKEEGQSDDAKQAAEELAKLRRDADKEKEEREEELRRRGYRLPETQGVPVEKNW